MGELNKFDLPAFFDRAYYESRYIAHLEKGNKELAATWEDFYFTNAIAYAFCEVFDTNKHIVGSKKAMAMAEERKKELLKEYK